MLLNQQLEASTLVDAAIDVLPAGRSLCDFSEPLPFRLLQHPSADLRHLILRQGIFDEAITPPRMSERNRSISLVG